VQQHIKTEVQSAVQSAIEATVASSGQLLASKQGSELMHRLAKEAGNAAVKAGSTSVKEYGAEVSQMTNALDSEIGGLVSSSSSSSSSSARQTGVGSSRGRHTTKAGNWLSLADKILERQIVPKSAGGATRMDSTLYTPSQDAKMKRNTAEQAQVVEEEKRIAREAAYQVCVCMCVCVCVCACVCVCVCVCLLCACAPKNDT
jgi:hypothetical protein